LFIGFGALLVLMAILCADSLHTLSAFAVNSAQVRQDFLYRERTLEQVRESLYESGNIVRDYTLPDSDATVRAALRTELQSIRETTDATLGACVQSLPEAQKAPFQKLAEQLSLYWATLDPILTLGANGRPGGNDSLLRNETLLQHSHTLAIAAEVGSVNTDDLNEAERSAAAALAGFRLRFIAAASVAFGIGLILAGATIVYSGRLEDSIEKKYEESLAARHQLQDVSKRLVGTEERERRAISRELHDEVGQSLSALLVNVDNLAAMSDQSAVFQQELQSIKKLAETCVSEVRDMALLLRPSMLDDLGLVAAVEWQAREVSKRTGMVVDTSDENVSDELPEEHKICMYRVVQEALNNCSKHAGAKRVGVLVKQVPGHLQVSVEDDGKGFDAAHVRGLGLLGMSERVSQLGGALEVKSELGEGTRLLVDLPLPCRETTGESTP
jgi:signal transduction histidine kinase